MLSSKGKFGNSLRITKCCVINSMTCDTNHGQTKCVSYYDIIIDLISSIFNKSNGAWPQEVF